MSVLQNLEPKNVYRFFEQMCAIPHGSRNTKAISDWCVAFARERGLEYYQDEANNVILIKEASAGYEHAEASLMRMTLLASSRRLPQAMSMPRL